MACGSNSTNSNLRSLYVGDLSPEVNEAILFKIFSKIGEVTHLRVCRDKYTKKSRGYAFVNFKNHEDSKEAFNKLNYEPILGKPCRIMWQERDHSKRRLGLGNVYVKNFDKNVDSRALYELFSEFGNILSCKVATDEKGESRGFGFVHFDKAEDGERAIEKMHGKLLNKNQLFVCKFKGREDAQSQGVLGERESLRDRYTKEEIRPDAVMHPEESRLTSRRRYAERLRNSRSVPRGYRRIGTGDLETRPSDDSDEDLDRAAPVTGVTDMISEVATREHPNEANLIVRLVKEKCDECDEVRSILLGSRTLLENEVEKAFRKIKRLDSPPI